MDRDRFLRELDEIRTGRRAPDSSGATTTAAAASVDGDEGLCNRIYLKLVECLAYESKNVEAKLQVLTSALSYYVDLRPHYDIMSPEADAFGHYLFMECSRLVLGIEFHHLKSDDTFKCAFKGAIGDVYRKLQDYAIGQVFLVLEWLMVNQWSHPTLVAMMKGEDIDKERALTYIRSGEYPELFRLRVEMLMESGCDNFASNLVSWCVQSPLFEGDVPLRSTHLLLLHKLGRNEQLHNQCCQLSCCIAKDILRHLMTRSEEPSFLLLMAQTFLLLNWIKPEDFCCTKELLEFWLTIEHQGEPEGDKFLDSINKVISLTQDIRQITIFLEVMVELFESKFVQFCTLLALNSLRKERHRLEIARDCQKDEREAEDATGNLVRICRLVARLYAHHHQMYLACLLTVLYLEPNGSNFLAVESFVQDLADIPPTEPHCPITVDPHHYAAVLETVELLRPSKFHLKFGWKDLKLFFLSHLESAGYKFDPDKNVLVQVVDRNQLVGRTSLRLRINPEKLSTYVGGSIDSSHEVDEKAVDSFCSISVAQDLVMSRDENAGNARQVASPVHFNFSHIQDSSNVLGDLKLLDVIKDSGDRWSSSGDGASSPTYPASLSSQKFVAVGDDSVVTIYQQQQLQAAADIYPLDSVASFSQLSGHQMVANRVHPGFTLDDIQQVLSATQTSCDGSSTGGTDIPMDERKLREITAFLLGRHPDGPMAFTAGICPAPLSASVNDGGTAMHASIGYNDSVIRPADSAMHPVVVTFDTTNCASAGGVFSSVSSVLPHDNRPEDMQFNASTSLSSSYSTHTSASSVSSSPASQKESFGLGKVVGPSAVVIPSNAFPSAANCLGSTILVTESNLPYLQQFLPNLQTVMQSVQSLVRGVPSQVNGSKPDSHLIGSKDDSTDSSDMLQEVPNVIVSSFVAIPASDHHSCFEHGSPPKMARTASATELAPVDGCTATCGIQLDKADRLPDVDHEAADDAGENVLRSKEKCRLVSKEGTDPDKFCCRFCRRGFSTMAQRRRHTEWLCPKKKAAHPTAQVSSCLKCDPSGKTTFVAKLSHATDMLQAEFEQKTAEAAIDLDAASPNVRLPDDVTLRDCFVKIVRMDKNSEGSSDEGIPLEELNLLKKEIDEKESGGGLSEEACMCERCGEILSSYSKLNVHKDHCNVTLPLELSRSSEKLSAENIPLKQRASCSILALNSAGQPVSCNVNTSNSTGGMIYNGLLPRVAFSEHNTYFVKNPGQVGALTMPDSTGIKQGAVLEMLQLADHFLKHNKFVANGSPAPPKAPEQVSETKPKMELSSGGLNAIFRSRFVAPVVATPTKSNPLSADVSCMPPIGVFSSPTGKRVVTIKTVGFNPHESLAGSRVCWPKTEQEKSDGGSTFQLNVKPDVVVDGHLSVGKEILYEGTKMREYVEFQCETCLLTFNEGTSANSHVEGSDHGNSSVASYHVYVCTSCNIKYRDKQVMRNHILYICTGNSLGTMITANQRQLHKCNLCSKAFISGEFLQVHLSLKHGMKNKIVLPSQAWLSGKVAFPADAMAAPAKELQSTPTESAPCTLSDGAAGGTLAFQKTLWPSSASTATVATGTPQPYRFTTPSAVSIPTLEQLTSGYGKTSSSNEKDKAKYPDLAASHQATGMLSPLGSSSVPDILASIPEHGDAKQAAATSTDVRQLVGGVAPGACLKQRSSKAKGILYKNVFMQCEGTYYCSVCKADLSARESKKNHRQMPCGDPKTITYSRKYSYLCPYCVERFPSQKTCRQHQVSECLPLIGISTEELSVKELICPLCSKKYFNLIPLKGHMTQVHKLPKVETREILLRLGYMDPNVADDQGKASSDGGFVLPEGMVQQRSLSSGDYTSGDHTSSTEVEFVQRSMLFDFENDVDVSSECAVQGQDILIQNSCEQCPEMEVIYDGEIFINQEDKKLKDDDVDLTVTEEMEINSVILGGEEARLVNFSGSEKNPSIGMDQYLGNWSDDGGNLSEMAVSKPQSFLQEAPADSTVSPEQRRRKPRQANEFFVMMFRNYPILAKGVSICAGCQAQMSSNSEVENHLSSATCRAADGRPADIKRSTIFKCTHCDKTFWKAKTCRQHQLDACLPLNGVEIDNLVQPSVGCPLCSAKSYNRSGLMSHMKYKHGMDTKGVRDIMEQYGIHKKTAELVAPPLSASSGGGSTVGSSSSTTASVGADGVQDLPSNGNFQKSVNHFDLDGAKRLYALESAGAHLNSKNPQSSPLVGESCATQFGAKSDGAAGDQFEVQRLYASIGSLGQDQDHAAMVGTSFNSIT